MYQHFWEIVSYQKPDKSYFSPSLLTFNSECLHDSIMTIFFQFEADFVDSLRCIPMIVRYKLDTCGIKLKLGDWQKMDHRDRLTLASMPCDTTSEIIAYRTHVQELVLTLTGQPASELPQDTPQEWLDSENIPTPVQTKAAEFNLHLTPQQWKNLSPLQRFALIKLSRSGHENKNFPRAIAEFQLD